MTHRILIVVHGYPPTARAGAEIHAAECASLMAEQGNEVRVLTFETWKAGPLTSEDTVERGVLVRRLSGDPTTGQDPFRASYDSDAVARAMHDFVEWRPAPRVPVQRVPDVVDRRPTRRRPRHAGGDQPDRLLVVLPPNQPAACRAAGDATARRPAGCTRCHAEAAPALAAARGGDAGTPHGGSGGGRTADPAAPAGLGIQAVRDRGACFRGASARQRVDRTVAVPRRVLPEARHRLERLHLIRQGLDIGPHPDRVPSDRLRVAFLGQLKSHKGVMTLLEAWSRLEGPLPRSLTLWGSASGEEAFGERVREMTGRLHDVEWRGAFPPGDVWQVLASTDVLVIPSLWVENSPNVILEAQSMKIPVVGSNIGGIAELVQHDRNGLVFETGNAPDLGQAASASARRAGPERTVVPHAPPVRTTADEWQTCPTVPPTFARLTAQESSRVDETAGRLDLVSVAARQRRQTARVPPPEGAGAPAPRLAAVVRRRRRPSIPGERRRSRSSATRSRSFRGTRSTAAA